MRSLPGSGLLKKGLLCLPSTIASDLLYDRGAGSMFGNKGLSNEPPSALPIA